MNRRQLIKALLVSPVAAYTPKVVGDEVVWLPPARVGTDFARADGGTIDGRMIRRESIGVRR